MARLQKKRKSGPKKKKKSESKPSVTPAGEAPNGKNQSSVAVSSVGAKRLRSVPSKRTKTKAVAKTGGRKNYIDIAAQFLREVVMELKKVTWPSRKQATGSTVVMLILVAIISIFLGTVDIGLSKLVQMVLQ